jgi:acyl-ACP thioesterase
VQPVWSENLRIWSTAVDFHKELSLYGLLGLVQESAWEHAEQLGCGYEAMQQHGLIWVLIRQKLEVTSLPRWGQSVTVRTWLRPAEGLLVTRDFAFSGNDAIFCEGATQYLMMDQATRRPARAPLPGEMFYTLERGRFDPQKIVAVQALPRLAVFAIRTSDLDMHSHVNNIRIAQWITDALPGQAHLTQRLRSYEVDFLAEMHGGETIAIEAGRLPDGRWHFQGRRVEDGKVTFAARAASVARL